MRRISGSMLYDAVLCPHRVFQDVHGDRSEREPPNEFLTMLWEEGFVHEKQVIESLSPPATDLSHLKDDEKERATWEAIERGDDLIYGGRLTHEDLAGEPDLLRKSAAGYIPGDIKFGSGEQDEGTGHYKKHYALQLAHYVHLMQGLGLSSGPPLGFVIDRHRREVAYELDRPLSSRNPRTWFEEYTATLGWIRDVLAGRASSKPAASAPCKLCEWRSECFGQLRAMDDLTLIPEVGRAKRDVMEPLIPTVAHFAAMDVEPLCRGDKTQFQGIGAGSLRKFQERARLLCDPAARPYTRTPILLKTDCPLVFFDVETDPLRDVCYLHGFLELAAQGSEPRYFAAFADDADPALERVAFVEAVEFVRRLPPGTCIVHYSKYERTTWRALQVKYPDVVGAEEIEALFLAPRAIDLLDVVRNTEWPTNDHSIKSLAKYLGFAWRDTDPSGASSIGWYHEWLETRDERTKQRILAYNEDDCMATLVLHEGLRGLPIRN